jgi:hypothetical protein
MIQPRRYNPVGRCIYCGRKETDDLPLGDEHIIPLTIGGNQVLPHASCHDCERTIQKQFEDYCLNRLFHVARAHLGSYGRNSGRARKHITHRAQDGSRNSEKVAITDDAGAVSMFVFWPPTILAGFPPKESIHGNLSTFNVPPDAQERMNRLNAGGANHIH